MNKSILATCLMLFIGVLSSFGQEEPFPFDVEGGKNAKGSIYIENLITGDVVMDINGDLPLIPASVTKLVTAATVLENTPKDFRYSTKVYLTGHLKGSILNGNILVHSSGDPTLESAHFAEQGGFADSIVSAVTRLGIKEIRGRVIAQYDKHLEEPTPEGWMESDLVWGYGTGYHGVNFRDNCFVLSLPGKGSCPTVPGLEVQIDKRRGSVDYRRKRGSNTIKVTGRIPKRGVREKLANPNPEGSMCSEIREKLEAAGVMVRNENTGNRDSRLILDHQSATLLEILQSTMYRSDNLMAEAMLKLSCPGDSRRKAADKEMRLWQKRDMDCYGLTLKDGSGLSRDNRLSAYFLADVLVWKGFEHLDLDYVELFPKCGEQGTVRNLLKNTHLQGRIALKSGSMNGVKCYAGYAVNEDGLPTHAIVIMVNDFKGNMARLKKAIETVLLENIS